MFSGRIVNKLLRYAKSALVTQKIGRKLQQKSFFSRVVKDKCSVKVYGFAGLPL